VSCYVAGTVVNDLWIGRGGRCGANWVQLHGHGDGEEFGSFRWTRGRVQTRAANSVGVVPRKEQRGRSRCVEGFEILARPSYGL
jgi:hypothetical protein